MPSWTIDELTGLGDAAGWQALVASRGAAAAGDRAPSVVVTFELTMATRKGGGFVETRQVEPVLAAVGRVLANETRSTDRLARVEPRLFVGLLDGIAGEHASAVISRARQRCAPWLDAADVAVELQAGWADVAGSGGIDAALRIARRRARYLSKAPEPSAAPGLESVRREPSATPDPRSRPDRRAGRTDNGASS